MLSSLAEARGISGLSLDALTDYMQLSRRRLLPQETWRFLWISIVKNDAFTIALLRGNIA